MIGRIAGQLEAFKSSKLDHELLAIADADAAEKGAGSEVKCTLARGCSFVMGALAFDSLSTRLARRGKTY